MSPPSVADRQATTTRADRESRSSTTSKPSCQRACKSFEYFYLTACRVVQQPIAKTNVFRDSTGAGRTHTLSRNQAWREDIGQHACRRGRSNQRFSACDEDNANFRGHEMAKGGALTIPAGCIPGAQLRLAMLMVIKKLGSSRALLHSSCRHLS
jgi:hypothetical protein